MIMANTAPERKESFVKRCFVAGGAPVVGERPAMGLLSFVGDGDEFFVCCSHAYSSSSIRGFLCVRFVSRLLFLYVAPAPYLVYTLPACPGCMVPFCLVVFQLWVLVTASRALGGKTYSRE